MSEYFDSRIYVAQFGAVMYNVFARIEQGGCKYGQDAVFGSVYIDRAD
jgi:hypothetical protein